MGLNEEYNELLVKYRLHSYADKDLQHFLREYDLGDEKLERMKVFDKEYYEMINAIKANTEKFKDSLTRHSVSEDLMRQYQERAETYFKNAGYKLNVPLLFKEFPTGKFNAQIVKVKSGYLVLINTGLMVLLNKVVKIFLMDMLAEMYRDQDVSFIFERKKNETTLRNTKLLLQAIVAYLVYGEAAASQYISSNLPTSYNLIRGRMLIGIEEFVVAHELGHAINGDLQDNNSDAIDTPAGKLDVVSKNWMKEFRADLVAIDVLFMEFEKRKKEKPEWLDTHTYILFGPFIFLEIDRLVHKVAGSLAGKSYKDMLSDTHPSSEKRSQIISAFLSEKHSTRIIEDLGNTAGWGLLMLEWLLWKEEEITGEEVDFDNG